MLHKSGNSLGFGKSFRHARWATVRGGVGTRAWILLKQEGLDEPVSHLHADHIAKSNPVLS